MPPDPIDLQGCEHCSKEFPIETMTMMGDCWFCVGCYFEWRAEFEACQHDWAPGHFDGEPGKLCNKCSGFIRDEAA